MWADSILCKWVMTILGDRWAFLVQLALRLLSDPKLFLFWHVQLETHAALACLLIKVCFTSHIQSNLVPVSLEFIDHIEGGIDRLLCLLDQGVNPIALSDSFLITFILFRLFVLIDILYTCAFGWSLQRLLKGFILKNSTKYSLSFFLFLIASWWLLFGAFLNRLESKLQLLFIFQLFIETHKELFIFLVLGRQAVLLLFDILQPFHRALMLNLFIYLVEHDVSRLTNLLRAWLLKFQLGAGHELFDELSYTLLLSL